VLAEGAPPDRRLSTGASRVRSDPGRIVSEMEAPGGPTPARWWSRSVSPVTGAARRWNRSTRTTAARLAATSFRAAAGSHALRDGVIQPR
jgi:hypothetical protein